MNDTPTIEKGVNRLRLTGVMKDRHATCLFRALRAVGISCLNAFAVGWVIVTLLLQRHPSHPCIRVENHVFLAVWVGNHLHPCDGLATVERWGAPPQGGREVKIRLYT